MAVPRFVDYWVLLLDILGFSAQMADEKKRAELASAYHDIVDALPSPSNVVMSAHVRPMNMEHESVEARLEKMKREWSDHVRVFSDSMFFFFGGYIPNTHPASPYLLGATAREIMTRLWLRRIPHRGSIAFGPCHLNPTKNIFVGPAIVEAHRWEQAQNWLGVSVAPGSSLFNARANNAGPATGSAGIGRASFVQDASVPTKKGYETTWALNPFKRLIPPEIAGKEGDLLPYFIDCYEEAKRTAPDALPKYANTARFLLSQGIGTEEPALAEIARICA